LEGKGKKKESFLWEIFFFFYKKKKKLAGEPPTTTAGPPSKPERRRQVTGCSGIDQLLTKANKKKSDKKENFYLTIGAFGPLGAFVFLVGLVYLGLM